MQKIREVEFLGVVIEPDRVKIEKEKVWKIVDWPVPRSIKSIQKFLGLANYYRQFVENFRRVTKLFYKTTRKNMKQNWRKRQQKKFEKLKKRFITELVLVILNLNKEIRVKMDILDFAIEGVLSIKYEDEKWRLVTYISKSLNKVKEIIRFTIKRYWQLLGVQRYKGISQKVLRISSKFGPIIKT